MAKSYYTYILQTVLNNTGMNDHDIAKILQIYINWTFNAHFVKLILSNDYVFVCSIVVYRFQCTFFAKLFFG